jgi:hypothetical protein
MRSPALLLMDSHLQLDGTLVQLEALRVSVCPNVVRLGHRHLNPRIGDHSVVSHGFGCCRHVSRKHSWSFRYILEHQVAKLDGLLS